MSKYKRLTLLTVICLFVFTAGCTSRKIDEYEKNLLINANDVQTCLNLPLIQTASCEQYSGKSFITGSTETDYKFDSRKNAANKTGVLVINTIIDTLPSVSVADSSFEQRLRGYKLGLSLSNKEAGLSEDPSLFTWGDENYSAYLMMQGHKMGNYVMTRKGNIIFTFTVVGLYIDDPKTMAELLEPKLEKATRYYKK